MIILSKRLIPCWFRFQYFLWVFLNFGKVGYNNKNSILWNWEAHKFITISSFWEFHIASWSRRFGRFPTKFGRGLILQQSRRRCNQLTRCQQRSRSEQCQRVALEHGTIRFIFPWTWWKVYVQQSCQVQSQQFWQLPPGWWAHSEA